jgi:hypothetical protein
MTCRTNYRAHLQLEPLEDRLLLACPPEFIDTDDSISEAHALGAMSEIRTANGALVCDYDVNFYQFSTVYGQTVKFKINFAPASVPTAHLAVRVFNSEGRDVGSVFDGGALIFDDQVMPFGTYYLGVSIFNNITYDPITGGNDGGVTEDIGGTYTLTLTPEGGQPNNDPDDQFSEATPGEIGTVVGTISTATDVDMYRFSVTDYQSLEFLALPDLDSAFQVKPHLRLFHSDGRELTHSSSDPRFPGPPYDSAYLQYTFYAGGIYYAAISSSGNTAYNPIDGTGDGGGSTIGGYEFVVRSVDDLPDPVDTIAEAAPLGDLRFNPYLEVDGFIEESSSVQMWRFLVKKKQKIAFDIDRPSGSHLDSYLRVFQVSKRGVAGELAENDDGPHPTEAPSRESYLEYKFKKAGIYYIGVSAFPNYLYNPITGGEDDTRNPLTGEPYNAGIHDVVHGEYTLTAIHLTKRGPQPTAAARLADAFLLLEEERGKPQADETDSDGWPASSSTVSPGS